MLDGDVAWLCPAIYCRVSTTEQREEGYSLGAQAKELRALAARRSYTLVGEFIEDASGALLRRPQMDRLLAEVRAGHVDRVLILSPDRLARDTEVATTLSNEIADRGAAIEYATITIPDTPTGRFMGTVVNGLSQLERETIRARTMTGRAEKLAQGQRPGSPPPYGYRLDADGALAIDDPEARVVRTMFAWVARGGSVRGLAADLTRQGLRTRRGQPWALSTLAWILTNPVYTGAEIFGRLVARPKDRTTGKRPKPLLQPSAAWTKVPCPVMIERAVAAQVERQLARNRVVLSGRRTTRGHIYLLRSLVHCGVCGSRYVGQGGPRVRYYRCGKRFALAHQCRGRDLNAARIEQQVWDTLAAIIRRPETLREDVERKQAQQGANAIEVRSAVEHGRRKLADAQRRERKLLALYEDEDLAPESFRTRYAEVAAEVAALKLQVTEDEAKAASQQERAIEFGAVEAWCRRARRGLDRLDRTGQQALLRDAVDRVTVHADRLEIETIFATATTTQGTEQSRLAS